MHKEQTVSKKAIVLLILIAFVFFGIVLFKSFFQKQETSVTKIHWEHLA
jgi:hypothetical protein